MKVQLDTAMRVVALISGGKDSCFSMMQCVVAGHDIVALANLYPVGKGKNDLSYIISEHVRASTKKRLPNLIFDRILLINLML